ncbi:hypothetical protein Tco_0826373 [Tanacetum coccineum]
MIFISSLRVKKRSRRNIRNVVKQRVQVRRRVDVVFDDAFGGVGDEEVVVREGVVVISSSLDLLTNNCLEGIMVSLIFLEGLDEEALVEFMMSHEQKTTHPSQIDLSGRADQGVGSTSGIRACALRYFDLGKMELENSQNNSLAKLPILKLGEYEMWEIRIKQYFQIQDYALWEVIEYGNSWVPIPITAPESGPSTALKMTVPSTTEEKICKKNDVKARNLLLMALPNEHQLTFNQYADAQS